MTPELNHFQPLFFFAASVALTYLICRPIRLFALKHGIVDSPNGIHKTHEHPIPYLGGIAIFSVSVIVCGIYLYFAPGGIANLPRAITLLIPSILICIIGLIDDLQGLSPRSRLVWEIVGSVVVSIILVKQGYLTTFSESHLMNILFSVIWIVGVTNAVNFIDNLDGSASGTIAILSFNLSILSFMQDQHLIGFVSLILSGSCLGFLPWNLSPARLFLGDSGALFLGLVLSMLTLQFEFDSGYTLTAITVPIFVMAVPVLDAAVVITSRIKTSRQIMSSSRDHLSHRLINSGFSRKKTRNAIWILALFYSSFPILMSVIGPKIELLTTFIGLFLFVLNYLFFLRMNYE